MGDGSGGDWLWSAHDQSFGLDKYIPKKQTVTQF
jgi:hypothetical protein